MSNSSQFLGMKVEGSYGGWTRAIQKPIEDLYPYFKLAFDKGVTAVMWEQYTPGFNDGEPCEFSVMEAKVTSNALVAEAWLDDESPDMELAYPDEDFSDYDEYHYASWSEHPDGVEISKIEMPVDSVAFEDALRGVFGNDTKIVVTPGRVVQFEYDCGY